MYREITHNGKYRYVQSFKDKEGKTRRVSIVKNNKTRATEKEAYEELQEKINKILNPDQEVHHLGYYKEKYLEFKKPTLSYNSYLAYEARIKVVDDNEKLENVTKIKYDKILMEMRGELSPNAINLTRLVLNNFFKFIKKYYVKDFDVKLDFKFTKEEKALELQKIKYLEKDEIPDILKKIKNNTVRSIAVLQLHTGLRIGEVLALTPDDVDFKNKTISVSKTKLSNGKLSSPKTLSSIRTIEISDFIAKLLLDYISSNKFIFKITYLTIANHLRILNIHTHIFRHTHVALLIEQNVPIKVISQRLGHSDIKTTLSIYTHVTENMKVNLRNNLNNLSLFIPH
jgi:integrase|nr:MAG TPA: Integrase [Caudoviricetes sp.]